MNGSFYVSIIRDSRKGLLAGPFRDHGAALAMVEPARKVACEVDPWADFDAFGTRRIQGYEKPGVLNERLGL